MMNAYRDPWLEAKRRVDLMEQEVRTTGDEIHIHEGTATYDVEIHRITDDGEQVFKHKGVSSGPKDRFVFGYAAWTGNGQDLKVGVDHGDDGTIDDEEEMDDEE